MGKGEILDKVKSAWTWGYSYKGEGMPKWLLVYK
jgi:hypothetical protein